MSKIFFEEAMDDIKKTFKITSFIGSVKKSSFANLASGAKLLHQKYFFFQPI
jgi:hypothetical protein